MSLIPLYDNTNINQEGRTQLPCFDLTALMGTQPQVELPRRDENKQRERVKCNINFIMAPGIDQSWGLADIAVKCPPIGWEETFQFALPELKHLDALLAEEVRKSGMDYYPLKCDVFKAFDLTPLKKVRVVILGQDPYYQPHAFQPRPRAQGLSFSVASDDEKPKSLQVIMKEIERSIPGWRAEGPGNLTLWALQGVLLLNTGLTVNPGQSGSHVALWKGFLIKILRALGRERPGIIYVTWGSYAKDIDKHIDSRGVRLSCSHPAARGSYNTFAGCGHFSKINEILVQKKEAPIDWRVL